MIKNYLKTAFRNFRRNKMHSFINIAGLSVGMTVAMLIGLWIWDEVSYNKYHSNYDRIAKVIQNVTNNGEVQTWHAVPYPLAEELRKNYGSDFKEVTLSAWHGSHLMGYGEKKINRQGIFIEPNGPSLFSLRMIKGSMDALKDPSSVLISASAAKTYFGSDDPMNKTLRIDNELDVTVKGVFEDIPANSELADLSFMAPWQLVYNSNEWLRTMPDPWRPNAFIVYVQLNPTADFHIVSQKIRDSKLKKVNSELAKKKPAVFLHPMSDWHLRSEFENGINKGGRIGYVWMFAAIGFFVLLLACINFMNLSTARSEKRAKEVGIRKAIGSMRMHLVTQFLGESAVMAGVAFILAFLLVQITLPVFNEIAEKKIAFPWSNPLFWLGSIGFTLITALVAGSYPAIYLSSFRPVKVLKGTFKAGRWAVIPRKALVVVQFTVSVALIIGTITIYRQISHAKNRPLGYNNNRLVSVYSAGRPIQKQFEVIKAELVNQGAITHMALSESPVTSTYNSSSGVRWKGKDPNLSIDFAMVGSGFGYGETIGWEIREGRDFSKAMATDSFACVLNEAAVQFMGMQKPVGEIIDWNGQQLSVIGVVKNLVMRSPYEPVTPIVYYLEGEANRIALLKLNPSHSAGESMEKIEALFKKFNPEIPFDYQFADEAYNTKFASEQRIGKLASVFAILAVFISCLGIFGLASFVAEQRTKEIGVRKVLGASVFNCWQRLSKDFVLPVIISLLIAAPLAWYYMSEWLQNFTYRTSISWWVFLAAGCGALFITLITVSFQSIKAALMNPVKSLRTE